MKKLVVIIIVLLIPLTVHAQVFVYGLVKNADLTDTQDKAIYNAIDETLMDSLFENGFVCFNGRDEKEFQLETALFAATTTGSRYVIIWQVINKQQLQINVYGVDGTEYKELRAIIDVQALSGGNTKILADRYIMATKQALPKIITVLRKGG